MYIVTARRVFGAVDNKLRDVYNVKLCAKCKTPKDDQCFSPNVKMTSGLASYCKECVNGNDRNKRITRPEWYKEKIGRRWHHEGSTYRATLRKFNLTPEQYEERLASQNYQCAICKSVDSFTAGRFHVDHDHSCCSGNKSCGNCVRGLLCARCNGGIGSLNDDPELLRVAIIYLESRSVNAIRG